MSSAMKFTPPTDPLEALLNNCRRNHRPAKFRKPPERLYFDADRFRWWFTHRDGKSLQQWRDEIDAQMRKESSSG